MHTAHPVQYTLSTLYNMYCTSFYITHKPLVQCTLRTLYNTNFTPCSTKSCWSADQTEFLTRYSECDFYTFFSQDNLHYSVFLRYVKSLLHTFVLVLCHHLNNQLIQSMSLPFRKMRRHLRTTGPFKQ